MDWIDRLSRNVLPETFVPPTVCALSAALTGFLGFWEKRLGIAAGTLAGAPLRDALSSLGPGAIEIAAEAGTPLFAPGDRVDPCVSCARLVANLVEQGLAPDVIAPGADPLPIRHAIVISPE